MKLISLFLSLVFISQQALALPVYHVDILETYPDGSSKISINTRGDPVPPNTQAIIEVNGQGYLANVTESSYPGGRWVPTDSVGPVSSDQNSMEWSSQDNQPDVRGGPPSGVGASSSGLPGGSGNGNGLGSLGGEAAGVLKGAMGAGLVAGVATAIYRGAVFSAADQAAVAAAQGRIQAQVDRENANHQEINKIGADVYKNIFDNRESISKALTPLDLNRGITHADDYKFKTTDPQYRGALEENRSVLNSIPAFGDKRREARDLGLDMNAKADTSYSTGFIAEGNAYLKYARGFADLAIGLDPITGPIRDTYEAFTGKNLITGELLDNWSRSFAVIGAVTFGFGSKIGRGLQIFDKIAPHAAAWISRFSRESKTIKFSSEYQKAWCAIQSQVKSGQLAENFLENLGKEEHLLNHYVDLVNDVRGKSVKIEMEIGKTVEIEQELTRDALDGYYYIKRDGSVYRQGNFKNSRINMRGDAPPTWAIEFEKMGAKDYANQVGGHSGDLIEFVEHGHVNEGSNFIVRKAPSGGYDQAGRFVPTKGGALEVVVEKNGVTTTQFTDLTGVIK